MTIQAKPVKQRPLARSVARLRAAAARPVRYGHKLLLVPVGFVTAGVAMISVPAGLIAVGVMLAAWLLKTPVEASRGDSP